MALDCYVVKEKDSTYTVSRYKSLELMETVEVPLSGQVQGSIEKRRVIVKKWLKEGKPLGAVYWFDGQEVAGVIL